MAHSTQVRDTSADPHCQGRGESGTKGGCKEAPKLTLTASKQAHPNGCIRAFYTNARTDTHRHAETYPDTHRNTHTDRHDCRGTQRHRCATQTLRQTHTYTHKGTHRYTYTCSSTTSLAVWPMCFPWQGCLNIRKWGKKPKFC